VPDLTQEEFAACLNTRFAIDDVSGTVWLKLVEVNAHDHSPRLDTFSLIFLGPPQPSLSQAIYRMEHETLGSQEIFIAPLGPQRDALAYEAVFNRIRKDEK
jgi:hypothetical protein